MFDRSVWCCSCARYASHHLLFSCGIIKASSPHPTAGHNSCQGKKCNMRTLLDGIHQCWLSCSKTKYEVFRVPIRAVSAANTPPPWHNAGNPKQNKVHYLRETPKAEGADLLPRSVLHMNHGFGASSSSWAPVIRRLSAALGALTVAHDTPGFGLTARAPLWRTRRYSLDSNAGEADVCGRRSEGHLARVGCAVDLSFIMCGGRRSSE